MRLTRSGLSSLGDIPHTDRRSRCHGKFDVPGHFLMLPGMRLPDDHPRGPVSRQVAYHRSRAALRRNLDFGASILQRRSISRLRTNRDTLLDLQSSVRRIALKQLPCLFNHVFDAQGNECVAGLLRLFARILAGDADDLCGVAVRQLA